MVRGAAVQGELHPVVVRLARLRDVDAVGLVGAEVLVDPAHALDLEPVVVHALLLDRVLRGVHALVQTGTRIARRTMRRCCEEVAHSHGETERADVAGRERRALVLLPPVTRVVRTERDVHRRSVTEGDGRLHAPRLRLRRRERDGTGDDVRRRIAMVEDVRLVPAGARDVDLGLHRPPPVYALPSVSIASAAIVRSPENSVLSANDERNTLPSRQRRSVRRSAEFSD